MLNDLLFYVLIFSAVMVIVGLITAFSDDWKYHPKYDNRAAGCLTVIIWLPLLWLVWKLMSWLN